MATPIEDITVNKVNPDSPVQPYQRLIHSDGTQYTNRILIGTAATGLVRMEWVSARYSQVIPMNWSMILVTQLMSSHIPLGYLVADAQNLIVKAAMEQDMEWLCFIEHDVLIPPHTFMAFNRYMREERVPVVSGLYFTRSRPSDPLVFRGRGTNIHTEWEMGDKVWCDGVPTGCLLVHMAVIRAMWDDCEEYQLNDASGAHTVRRVFRIPNESHYDDDNPFQFLLATGTSDLDWCNRVIEGDYLRKAGWEKHADEHPEYPFLVDTGIFCRHINPDGEQFP